MNQHFATVQKLLATCELTPVGITTLVEGWKRTFRVNTRYTYATTLKRILRIIGREDLRAIVKRQQKPQPRETTATVEQVQRLHDLASPDMRLLVMLGAALALRWSEILQCGPETWNEEKHELRITVKGGERRTFAVPPYLQEAFHFAAQGGEGNFVQRLAGGQRGKPVSETTVRNRWKKLTKKAGVPHLVPHDLRRTAAVKLYEQTHDVFAVKALLGHDQLKTTAWYLKPHETNAMREIERRIATWNIKGEKIQ